MGALAESGSADGYYYAGRVRRAPALRAHHLPTPSRRRAAELWNFGGPGQTRVGLGCGRTRVVLSRSLGGQVYVLIVDVDGSPRPQGEGATGRKWTDISGVAWAVAARDIQREREREREADDTASRKEGDGICLVLSRLIRVWARHSGRATRVVVSMAASRSAPTLCHSATLLCSSLLSPSYPLPSPRESPDKTLGREMDGRTDAALAHRGAGGAIYADAAGARRLHDECTDGRWQQGSP